MSVRVRIAPAPSGSLHVGNVRTALFNWLFARHEGGHFILRVEDTDPSRVVEEHYQTVQDDLLWLGLDWDEGPGAGGPHAPYLQSERAEIYREAVDRLIETGAAYRCYCTPEELKQRREAALAAGRPPRYDRRCYRLSEAERNARDKEGRPFTVRIHVPEEGITSFDDIVTGEVAFENADLDDVVLMRSDGRALYNLAAAVDDGAMAITHVVRGLDLQSSTPYQILIHQALGFEVPAYAHLPLINGPDGKPLSKRHGPTALAWYRESGYLPEAMMNYLALLGWGLGDETIIGRAELIEKFRLEDVHASPARFDPQKLKWMNGEYIRMLEDADLAARVTPWLAASGLVADQPTREEQEKISAAAVVIKTRITTLAEAPAWLGPWFTDVEPDPKDVEKVLGQEYVPDLLERARAALESLPNWDVASIEQALRGVIETVGVKPRVAFRPLYVAISGRAASAPLFDTMAAVGREKSLERIERARALLA